jgi:hypothetical protein
LTELFHFCVRGSQLIPKAFGKSRSALQLRNLGAKVIVFGLSNRQLLPQRLRVPQLLSGLLQLRLEAARFVP